MDLDKIRILGGVEINTTQQRKFSKNKEKLGEADKSEDLTEAADEKSTTVRAINAALKYLDQQAESEKDRGQKAMYYNDGDGYETLLALVKAGRLKDASKHFHNMETAARDVLFDVVKDVAKRKIVADHLDVELLHENCGQSHGAEDEEIGMSPFVIKLSDKTICPVCREEIATDMMQMHMDSTHPHEGGCGAEDEEDLAQHKDNYNKGYIPDEEFDDMKSGSGKSSGYEGDNEEDEEVRSFEKGQKVDYDGKKFSVEVPDAQGDFVGIVPVGQEGNEDMVDLVKAHKLKLTEGAKKKELTKKEKLEKAITQYQSSSEHYFTREQAVDHLKRSKPELFEAEKAVDATVFDATPNDVDESPESPMNDDNTKIVTPPAVKKALKAEITQLRKESDKVKIRDAATSEFYDNCADAMEVILDCLAQGTVEGMKKAQIHTTKLMSPIIQRIPNVAYKFITSGGVKTSLKDLFHEVKAKK